VADEVSAWLTTIDPGTASAGTPATISTVRGSPPTARSPGKVQVTVPPEAPTTGVTHMPPAEGVADWKVSSAGRVSSITTSVAGSGPRFVTETT
jgi:hypothetical protein